MHARHVDALVRSLASGPSRFDALVKRFAVRQNRREGLRVLLAGLIAGTTAFANADEAAACKSARRRCRKHKQCCSQRCRPILRKGKHRKVCRCSSLQQRCNRVRDCCGAGGCGDNGCFGGVGPPSDVCCLLNGAVGCFDDCDCCGEATCGADGRCQGCGQSQEACERTSQCCRDDQICDTIDPACSPAGAKVCCGTAGSDCATDCDCCQPFHCDTDLGECVSPECPTSEVVCPAGSLQACCPEDFPVCCDPGAFQPCCPAGSSCTAQGCVTDQPNVCPAGADSCALPLVFCGGPPRQPLDCACYLDLAGNSFCSVGYDCGRECSSDAECEASPGSPGSRCVRCPETCGHNGGVCASPCFAPA